MSAEADQLLNAEAAVQSVLQHLQGLQREIEHYAQAKASLESVRKDLQVWISRTGALAEDTQQALQEVRALSMPAIFDRLANIRSDLLAAWEASAREAHERSQVLTSSLRAASEEDRKQLESLTRGLVADAAQSLGQMVERGFAGQARVLERLQAEVVQSLAAALEKQASDQAATLRALGLEQSARFAGVRRLGWAAIGLLALALGVLVWMAVSGRA